MTAKALAEFNPYFFLHLNFYKIDLLQFLLDFNETLNDERKTSEFKIEMFMIFSTMNDLHTLYLHPRPLHDSVATILFTVKRTFEVAEWRYTVSDSASDVDIYSPKSFRIGG